MSFFFPSSLGSSYWVGKKKKSEKCVYNQISCVDFIGFSQQTHVFAFLNKMNKKINKLNFTGCCKKKRSFSLCIGRIALKEATLANNKKYK